MQQERYDPYRLTASGIEEPPGSLCAALMRIGPGLILAGSIVGTGELIATTHIGAKVGFVLLWLVLFSCFIKVFVQIELGRSAIVSGQTTLASLDGVPRIGPLLTWWWLAMMLATQMQIGAMIGSIGQAVHMGIPEVVPLLDRAVARVVPGLAGSWTARPELPWAFLVTLLTAGLLVWGTYRLVERVSTFLVVVFTLVTVLCVVLLQWTDYRFGVAEIVSGLTFSFPREAILPAFAMFGITGVGASELVSYPYWCVEKGYARYVGPRDLSGWLVRARGWVGVMKLDAWGCMVLYTTATVSFYLLGAAVLHSFGGKGLPDDVEGMMRALARMYEPVLGNTGSVMFIVAGAFAVLYSTLFAATAANSRLLADFLRVRGYARIQSPEERLFWVRFACVLFLALGLILYCAMGSPPAMVVIGGFAQAVTLPMLAAVAVYLRYSSQEPALAPSLWGSMLLWLSFLAMLLAAGVVLVDQLAKLLGWSLPS